MHEQSRTPSVDNNPTHEKTIGARGRMLTKKEAMAAEDHKHIFIDWPASTTQRGSQTSSRHFAMSPNRRLLAPHQSSSPLCSCFPLCSLHVLPAVTVPGLPAPTPTCLSSFYLPFPSLRGRAPSTHQFAHAPLCTDAHWSL